MNSVSKRPLLFCPFAEFINEEDEFRSIQFGESLILSNADCDKSSLSSSSHLRPLDWCNIKAGIDDNFLCYICDIRLGNILSNGIWQIRTTFYSCKTCREVYKRPSYFHKECIEPISKHPYHPKHSLRLCLNSKAKRCLCCSYNKFFNYVCALCDFTMCKYCAREPPVLKIKHPKRHEHTLFYFPRKSSVICDICALSDHRSLMYSCHQCDFVVHKKCVYFPRIIKISRHEHRISFNSSLTPEKWLCGVCHEKIDTNYGRYTCVKDCSYGAHSKCATRKDVWDGKDLEGKPEDAYEDIKSFIEIKDGVIRHFSHQDHNMRLDEETNRAFDENKRFQACTLPICDDIIYNCVQCDFILHQQCAHLPRKIQHAMHPYLLSLQVDHHPFGYFYCAACKRESSGFGYMSNSTSDFILDVRCASIAEPLNHRCHPHPLFLTSEPGTKQTCSICHTSQYYNLNCGECGFVMCFGCATLPNKLRYKHDEHFLIFSYDQDASGQYWCEVCEKDANIKNGIYMCNDCNTTLHIQCLLGEDMYMKPGVMSTYLTNYVNILLNNRLTRNICSYCNNLCQEKIVYKISDREIFCSFRCMRRITSRYK